MQDGNTALILACVKGHVELAKLLLAAGADISAKNTGGEAPCHAASKNGHKDMAKLLKTVGS
ncbi:Ankyrin repeat domain-containing protein 11 [Tetrabaena socialis]|uniref:Ankyrin repeat domain-containing protein 11 n=1 Tax=Tetrabaena socialis TaxID=47790 RepID=A0A2J8A828_9CHLO|nr:Ankyrin repeat domain-containing protein 11 [Tetrabaena socialis]|eukprot:PNH08671.1 Ankyrin repeat domain-containing protein 11 [Tetrabaena socialis]